MKRMRIMGLCLVVAFAVAAVFASGASAKKLFLSTAAGELKAGDPLNTFSSNLIFETSAGNLECEENELGGKLETNGGGSDKASVTEESSKGNYLEIPGACKTSATGPVIIVSSGFPWPVQFKSNGTGKVKGTKKVTFDSTFLALEGPNNHCTFEASKVAFSFTVTAVKAPVELKTVKQTFKHAKKAPNQTALCPASGVLSGTFDAKKGKGGEVIEANTL